jgi:hypothetical protein
MSAEDFISKLFKENEHKLDEMPSDKLWSKIEMRLDTDIKSAETENKNENFQLKTVKSTKTYISWLIAASVLLFVLIFAFLSFPNTKEIVENYSTSEKITEQEQPTPVNQAEKDSLFIQNDSKQEKEIIAQILNQNKKSKNDTKINIDNVKISEKKAEVYIPQTENIALELNSEITFSQANSKTGSYDSKDNLSNRNYANPPSADPTKAVEIDIIASEAQNNSRAKRENSNASVLKTKRSAVKNQHSELNSRLKIFEWMLGKWIDEEEEGGTSYENWDIMNSTSISSNGFKMKGKNKIFEEKVMIEFDPALNQTFLKMPLNESGQTYSYLLTSFDNERIIFDQKEFPELPDRVIIQRNIVGYSFIIVFNSGFIQPAQQTYLEHRNRVSNVRAIRIFKPFKK